MDSLLSSNVPLSYLQALPTIDMNNNVDNNINTVNNNNNSNNNNGGNNNNNNNNAMYPPIVQPAGTKITQQPAPPKKRSSFTACAACQSKHCACDEQRPCSRCVRLRLPCTEGVPRKGKAKKKPQKDTSGGDFYVALERELLSGKYPSQFQPPPSPVTPISSISSVSSLPPPSPAYQMPSTPLSSFPPPSPSPAYQIPSTPISSFPPPSPAPSFSQDSIPPSPALSFVDSDFSVSSALSAEDIETQLFLYESALPLPSPLVIPPPATPSPSSSNLSSPSPLSSTSSDLEIGSTDPQFTTFLHSNTPVPHSFEKAIRHEHTNRMFAVSMMTSAMHPLQFLPNNNNNNNNTNNVTELESGKNMSHNFTTNNSPGSASSSSSSSSSPSSSFSSSSPSQSPTATLPASPVNNNNTNNNTYNNTNNHPLNFCASSPFSPHFPIPDQTSNSANPSNSSNPSNPSNPSNSSNSSMAQLQQELADLRQELAAARYRERLAFPLQRRIRPRDSAMSLWSLHDGMLVDYSAGFMKLMKYTQDMLKSLSFYEISPPSTRAQRRHLHAFFIKEKPEINGVVSYKSLLNAEGRPIEVMCSASVFYFDDQVLLQLLCFNQ